MTISKAYGLNVSRFPKLEISLDGFSGIQWDNGVGKGYLKNLICLGLSTRLSYEHQHQAMVKINPEISVLVSSTNANAKDSKKDEKTISEMLTVRLSELFNQNNNLSKKSFFMLEFSDNKIAITFPTTNIKDFSRLHILSKDNFNGEDIYKFLENKINIEDFSTKDAIIELMSELEYLNINYILTKSGQKSEFIKEKSIYFLGHKTQVEHGKMILMGVSDNTLNILNEIVVNDSIDRLDVELRKSSQLGEEPLVEFLETKHRFLTKLSNLIKLKDINKDSLEKKVFTISKLLNDSRVDRFLELYKAYQEREAIVLSDTKTKKESAEKLLISLKVKREEEKSFNSDIIKKLQNLNQIKKQFENNLDSIKRAKKELNVPEKSLIEVREENNQIKGMVDSLKKQLESNDSISEQIARKIKSIKELESNLNLNKRKLQSTIKEKLETEKTFKERDLYFFGSPQSSEDVDLVLYLLKSTKIKKENVSDIEVYTKIANLIRLNPESFSVSYRDLLLEAESEKENFVSKIKHEALIKQKDRDIENLHNLVDSETEKLYISKKELAHLEKSVSKDDLKKKYDELKNNLFRRETQLTILEGVNNPDNIINTISEDAAILNKFNDDIYSLFRKEFSSESFNKQNEGLEFLLDFINSELKERIEKKEEKEKELKELDNIILNKEKEIKDFDRDFYAIQEDLSHINKFYENLGVTKEVFDNIVLTEFDVQLSIVELKSKLSEQYQKMMKKYDELQYAIHSSEFENEIKEFELERGKTYLSLLTMITTLKTHINAKITRIGVSTNSILINFQDDLKDLLNFVSVSNSIVKKHMKFMTKEISQFTCATGESYSVLDNKYLEDSAQEIQIKDLLNEIFQINDISYIDIDDNKIKESLERTSKENLENLMNAFSILMTTNNEMDLESFFKKKTREFTFEVKSASTGNSFVIDIAVRQFLMRKNKVFRMTTFIDEFSTMGKKNLDLTFSQDLSEPTVFMQCNESNFDSIRSKLSYINGVVPVGEMQFYNFKIWEWKGN